MIDIIYSIVWGDWLVLLILVCGVYFTIRIGFKQCNLKAVFRGTILSKSATQSGKGTLSPFQTMTTSLSASMGTGNIVGVASAITLGGAGAVLWMWVTSILGMALAYAENYLGVKYRTTLKDGSTVGGACAYLEYGLQCKPLAVVFALLCVGASFGMGNMAQANAITTSLEGTLNVPTGVTALVVATLVAVITVGGVKRIGEVTQYVLPVLSVGYVAVTLVVILSHVGNLPQAFKSILTGALGFNAMTGGFTGAILRDSIHVGICRGIFSNEAGLGSSSMLHSTTASDNPHTMGLWGTLEVSIDTLVCTLTALAVLVTGADTHTLDSTSLVVEAFKYGIGEYSGTFVTLAISLFAFATMVGWSVCGETCSKYLFGAVGVPVYKVAFVVCVLLGGVLNGKSVWTLSDIFNGLMAVPNLVGMVILSLPKHKKLLTVRQ